MQLGFLVSGTAGSASSASYNKAQTPARAGTAEATEAAEASSPSAPPAFELHFSIGQTSTTAKDNGNIYCKSVYDGFLCWRPTRVNDTVLQRCPQQPLSDTTKLAFRKCGPSGKWLDQHLNESEHGWSNYTLCFSKEVQILLKEVNQKDSQTIYHIAQTTRYLEIAGFSVSLVALLLSLMIFWRFRVLYNNRTKIHMNLFGAMVLQVVTRLLIYLEQEYFRKTAAGDVGKNTKHGIANLPNVCKVFYVVMEYGNSVVFLWMFMEGLYLNLILSNVLQESVLMWLMYVCGWTIPLAFTIIWAGVTAVEYKDLENCWFGYNFKKSYWIIQAPRLSIIVINYIFLFNIIRVLAQKLKQNDQTTHGVVSYKLLWLFEIRLEPQLLRILKAIRATFFLIPLLGLTNVFDMLEAPLNGPMWKFALWSYSVYFLRSFQGLFLALLYCLANGEVKTILKRHWQIIKAKREATRQMRATFRNGTQEDSQVAIQLSPPVQTEPPGYNMKYHRSIYNLENLPDMYASMPNVHAWRTSQINQSARLDASRRAMTVNDIEMIDRSFKNIQHQGGKAHSVPFQMKTLKKRMKRSYSWCQANSPYRRMKRVIYRPIIKRKVKKMSEFSFIHTENDNRKCRLSASSSLMALSTYNNENIYNLRKTESQKWKLETSDSMTSLNTFDTETIPEKPFKMEAENEKPDQIQKVSSHFVTTAVIEMNERRSFIPKEEIESDAEGTEAKKESRSSIPKEEIESDAEGTDAKKESRSSSSATDYARRSNYRRESYESNKSGTSGTSRKSVRFNLESTITQVSTDSDSE